MRLIVNFLFVSFFVTASLSVQAQEFVFHYNQTELEETESDLPNAEHPFGTDFTILMQLLSEKYTYKVENSISKTVTTMVEKPSIYYSVKKVNKHMVKSSKKERIPLEEAKTKLEDVLVKALNIRYQDTEVLEEKLNDIKDPEMIMAFYSNDIVLNM